MLVGASAARGIIRNSVLAPSLGRRCPCQTSGLSSWLSSESWLWDFKQVVYVNGEVIPVLELTKSIFSFEEQAHLL